MQHPAETLQAGAVPLATWRAIYFGAGAALDPACRAKVEAGARAIDRVVAAGAPVYGVNTGFGKLASVRIDTADLTTLQRNIVLSHCAGVGDPLPVPVTRLMMALKLASLAQGASGVRWATRRASGRVPRARTWCRSCRGRARSGPLATWRRWPTCRRRCSAWGSSWCAARACRRLQALAGAGLAPLVLGPKEGLALLNGTQASTALALAGLFETERVFQAALVTGALTTDAAKGSDGPFDPRIQALRGQPGQIDVAAALAQLMRGSAIRQSHLVGDGRVQDPVLPALPAAGDGRVSRPAAAGRAHARRRSQRRVRQPARVPRHRRGHLGRQLPRAAGGLCRRHHRARHLRDRLDCRAAPRHDGRPGAVGPAGVPHAQSRPQLGPDDSAGHGGRARVREQAAGVSGERGFDSHLGQSGRPRVDGGARRAPSRAHGRERRARDRHRAHRRGPGLRLPRAAAGRAIAWSAPSRCCAPTCRRSITTATSPTTSAPPPRSCARAGWSRPPASTTCPASASRAARAERWRRPTG